MPTYKLLSLEEIHHEAAEVLGREESMMVYRKNDPWMSKACVGLAAPASAGGSKYNGLVALSKDFYGLAAGLPKPSTSSRSKTASIRKGLE